MLSIIYELNEEGKIEEKARYTCNSKIALINYIKQFKEKNFNTWEYPKTLKGLRQSTIKNNVWYIDYNNMVISSIGK